MLNPFFIFFFIHRTLVMAEAFSSKVIMSPMNAHFYMLIVQVMDPVLPPTCVSF